MTITKYLRSSIHHLKRLKLSFQIPDYYWVDRVIEFHLDPDQVDYDKSCGALFLKEFDVNIEKEKDEFFLKGLSFARNLKNSVNAKFKKVEGEIQICLQNISLVIQTSEELFILHEIFIEGIYNLIAQKPVVILDIGMNTGFASLFFANRSYVLSVLAYEPIEKTYKQAINNFSLNSDLSKKIKSYNFGLSDMDRTVTVDYCYEFKGSVGINGMANWINSNHSVTKESLKLVNISEVMDNILKDYPNTDIVAKIDCEGSEYEIINALFEKNQLQNIKNIMLEWHDIEKNDQLLQQFLKSGFSLIYLNHSGKNSVGTIYASKVD